ncbi:MAG: tetratricopeptide repeat protein [Leeuwenhoekiella sp.]
MKKAKVVFGRADSLYKEKEYEAAKHLFIKTTEDGIFNYKDTLVVESFKKLGLIAWKEKEFSTAECFFQKALSKNASLRQQADLNYNIALLKRKNNQMDSCALYLDRALKLYINLPQQHNMYNAYRSAGVIFKDLQDFERAAIYLLKAYSGYSRRNDLNKMASVTNTMGNLQMSLRNIQKALEYYQESLVLYKASNDSTGMSYAFNNLGNSYRLLENWDKATVNYKEALTIKGEKSDAAASTYYNLGAVLYKKKEYTEAIENYQKSLILKNHHGVKSKLDNFNELLASSLALGKMNPAANYADSILKFLGNESDKILKMRAYEVLTKQAEAKKDFKSALDFQKQYARLYQKIYDEEKTEANERLEKQFERAKQENLILNLSLENQKKDLDLEREKMKTDTNRNVIAGLLFLLLAGSAFLFLWNKRREGKKEISRLEQIALAEERVKEAIGADLHDVVSTTLEGIRLKMIAAKNLGTYPERITEIISDLKDTNRQIRFIAHRLSPIEDRLEKHNINHLIKSQLSEFEVLNKVKVTLNQLPNVLEDFSKKAKSNLFGILLEILNNVTKHSQASELHIRVDEVDDHIHLLITDNGKGIQANADPGIGLINIQKRVKLMYGSITINSNRPNGTCHMLNLPIKKNRYEREN